MFHPESYSTFMWPDGSWLETWFPFPDLTYILGAIIGIVLTVKLWSFVSGSVFSLLKGVTLFGRFS